MHRLQVKHILLEIYKSYFKEKKDRDSLEESSRMFVQIENSRSTETTSCFVDI